MSRVADQPVRADAVGLAALADPYPVYAQLRAAGPICRGGPGTWVVTRHREVAALLADDRLSHRFPDSYRHFAVGDGPASELLQRIVSSQEAPAHPQARAALAAALTRALPRATGPHLRDVVAERLTAAADAGTIDLARDLAAPVALGVGCDLVGIPSADRDEVLRRADDLGRAFTALVLGPADRAGSDAAVRWLREYLGQLAHRRPGDDVLSTLGDALSPEQAIDNAIFVCFTAYQMTFDLVGGGCAALLAHPDQLARLRADRALMPTAIDEILRYDAPMQGTARRVVRPVTVAGQPIRPGRVLFLLLGSANHDERVFADPERLDLGRRPNPHLSYGGGVHACLGTGLAAAVGATVFGELLDRLDGLAPAGPPVRAETGSFKRSYASIPATAQSSKRHSSIRH